MSNPEEEINQLTPYEAFGGHDTFVRLVDRFYEGVATDALLRPMYPEEDLDGARERLTMFLEQYWGGPHTYSQTRGHPRLRLRHAPFQVTPDMRDRWLRHMNAALDLLELPQAELAEFREYVTRAAQFMINSFDN